jgi:hypothetical protein
MKPSRVSTRPVGSWILAGGGLLWAAAIIAGATYLGLDLLQRGPAERVSVPTISAATPEEAGGVVVGSLLVLAAVCLAWALAVAVTIARLGLGLMLLVASGMTGRGRPSGRLLLRTWAILTLLIEGPILWLSGGRDGWAWCGSIVAVAFLVVLMGMSGLRAPSRGGRPKPLPIGGLGFGELADDRP